MEYADSIPSACTPEGAASILRTIREKGLTRFVLASCVCCPLDLICGTCTDQRSRLKAAIFQGTGVPRAMAETCNLRGEALALLGSDRSLAISRFEGLLQRSIQRAARLKSLPIPARQYNFTTAVIGESEAALRSAQTLGQMGMEVFLFGGRDRPLTLAPAYPNVHAFPGSCARSLKGTVGDFRVIVSMQDGTHQVFSAGAVILGERSRKSMAYIPHPDMPPHDFEHGMQAKGRLGIPFFVPGATSISGLLMANPPGINVSERLKGTAAAILAATIMPRGPRQNKGYTVSINRGLCRGCGRCVQACPYKAISFHANPPLVGLRGCRRGPLQGLRQLHFDLSVQRGGQSISRQVFPGTGDRRNSSQMNDDLKIILFLCNWSPHAAFQTLQDTLAPLPREIRMIRIPCSGRITKSLLFKAFETGPTESSWSGANKAPAVTG